MLCRDQRPVLQVQTRTLLGLCADRRGFERNIYMWERDNVRYKSCTGFLLPSCCSTTLMQLPYEFVCVSHRESTPFKKKKYPPQKKSLLAAMTQWNTDEQLQSNGSNNQRVKREGTVRQSFRHGQRQTGVYWPLLNLVMWEMIWWRRMRNE